MSDWIDDPQQDHAGFDDPAASFGHDPAASTTEVHGDLTEVHQPDGSTVVYYDPNHDGTPDSVGYDRDSDGVFEQVDSDTNQDGHLDTTFLDFNHDGKIDAIIHEPDAGADINPYLRA